MNDEDDRFACRHQALLEAARPQPFGAAAFKETQIGCVIDASRKIGVFVIDAQGQPISRPLRSLVAYVFRHEASLRQVRSREKSVRTSIVGKPPRFDAPALRCYRRGMRIVFMGAPDFATPTLLEIIGQGHEIAAVYTRAPKPAGRRGLELTKTPVHLVAEQFSIPVLTPASLRDPLEQERFRALDADLAVVVAYGLILPQPILAAPGLGCLNLHASLLPRWRGAAPIQRAIMAGDRETGVCAMRMEEGLDTGPIALIERVAIAQEATTGDLSHRLARIGAELMARALSSLAQIAL